MGHWLQHALALALVAACAVYVVRQALRTLRGRASRFGSCCAKGCAAATPPKPGTQRVAFIPAEMLTRRKRG